MTFRSSINFGGLNKLVGNFLGLREYAAKVDLHCLYMLVWSAYYPWVFHRREQNIVHLFHLRCG